MAVEASATLVPGLVSVTFRALNAVEVLSAAVRCGLRGIEWGGDIHVPHGDTETAKAVGEATREAGLGVVCYGSYFRAGHSEQEGLSFDSVLASARALGAPVIRIWAGTRASSQADAAYRDWVARECRRVAERAGGEGLRVALEFHAGTLTDDLDSTLKLLAEADQPALRTLWQPRHGTGLSDRLNDLRHLAPFLEHVHVFHWPDGKQRLPLAEGAALWQPCFEALRGGGRDVPVLLEFVPGDEPAILEREAQALQSWL
ncbi:MAG: TIM barrel protein [Candidatus Methylacidiphilales bacterium]|nr:TIM barrel protein [Candidatus Methylacidiphilales bacterium]